MMRASLLALAAAAAIGLSANVAPAQEAGFGGQGSVSKNQVPGLGVNNPTDPAAGNPGSAAQVPTEPEAREDLYSGSDTPEVNEPPSTTMSKPESSNPPE